MKKIALLSSKAFFWGFTLFSSFVILLSLFSFLEYFFNWNIPLVEIFERSEQNFASIKTPFMQLNVEFLLSFKVVLMWGTMIYYSVYFYVLQNFFNLFIAKKTFKEQSLKKLTLFYKLNFIPVIVGFTGIVIRYIMFEALQFDEPHFFALIHLIIAFFLYFYLDLIREGNNIQQENDLTI